MKPRRWFQFSLRKFLIMVSLAGILAGIVIVVVRAWQEIREAERALFGLPPE